MYANHSHKVCFFFLFVNSLTEVEYSVERNEDKPLSVDEVGFVVVKQTVMPS